MSEEDVSGGGAGGDANVQVEDLQADECWRLLQEAPVARLAFVDADGHPEIYPVNIRTDHGVILVRSADDAKTRALTERPHVAVEVDGGTLRVRWSVIAHATAEVVADEAAEPPRETTALSWFPGAKSRSIRLTVGSITGRRFLVVAGARPPAPAAGSAAPSVVEGTSRRGQRPTPIPSRPPMDDGGSSSG